MSDNFNVFEKVVTQIITAFERNYSVDLKPSKAVKQALEEALKIVRSEAERKRKHAAKAGRKRKPDSELKNPEKALQMRRLREKWGANSKPPEADAE